LQHMPGRKWVGIALDLIKISMWRIISNINIKYLKENLLKQIFKDGLTKTLCHPKKHSLKINDFLQSRSFPQ